MEGGLQMSEVQKMTCEDESDLLKVEGSAGRGVDFEEMCGLSEHARLI